MNKNKIEEFSDWQFGRIRARLLAYYYFQKSKVQEKRDFDKNRLDELREHHTKKDAESIIKNEGISDQETDFSWLTVIYNIIDNEATEFNNSELDEGDYYDRDKALSLKEEAIRRMCNGYERPDANKRPYWAFSRPSSKVLSNYKNFLVEVGYLTDEEIDEPPVWPMMPQRFEKVRNDTFSQLSKRVLKAYDGDYRTAIEKEKLEIEKFFQISLPHTRGSIQRKEAQISLIRCVCENDGSKPLENWGADDWKYHRKKVRQFWGWMLVVKPNIGLIYLKSLEEKYPNKECYILTGTDLEESNLIKQLHISSIRVNRVSSDLFDIYCSKVAGNEKLSNDLSGVYTDILHKFTEANLTKFYQSNIIEKIKLVSMGLVSNVEERHEAEPLKLTPSELEGLIFGSQQDARMDTHKMRTDLSGNKAPDYVTIDLADISGPTSLGKRLQWVLVNATYNEFCEILQYASDTKCLAETINYPHEVSGATILHIAAAEVAPDYLVRLMEIDCIDYLIKDNDGELSSEVAFRQLDLYKIGEQLLQKEIEQANREGLNYPNILNPSGPI